jgi:hypothetical protein
MVENRPLTGLGRRRPALAARFVGRHSCPCGGITATVTRIGQLVSRQPADRGMINGLDMRGSNIIFALILQVAVIWAGRVKPLSAGL